MTTHDNAIYSFKVNGTEIKTRFDKLTAGDMLTLAISNEAIAGKSEDYILESIDPQRTFKADDVVDLSEYKLFLAEKTGPTPVAGVHS